MEKYLTKQEQDKLWNDLSEEKQKSAREMYKQITRPLNPAKSNAQNEADIMSFALETTFGSHNLKPILTFEDIAEEMSWNFTDAMENKERAIRQLLIVTKYLNEDWKPDLSDEDAKFYTLGIDNRDNSIKIIEVKPYYMFITEIVDFKEREFAEQAVQILGEETIRLALSCNY